MSFFDNVLAPPSFIGGGLAPPIERTPPPSDPLDGGRRTPPILAWPVAPIDRAPLNPDDARGAWDGGFADGFGGAGALMSSNRSSSPQPSL